MSHLLPTAEPWPDDGSHLRLGRWNGFPRPVRQRMVSGLTGLPFARFRIRSQNDFVEIHHLYSGSQDSRINRYTRLRKIYETGSDSDEPEALNGETLL